MQFFFFLSIYLFRLPWVSVETCGVFVVAGMWDLVPRPGIRPGAPCTGSKESYPPGPPGRYPECSSLINLPGRVPHPHPNPTNSCLVFLFSTLKFSMSPHSGLLWVDVLSSDFYCSNSICYLSGLKKFITFRWPFLLSCAIVVLLFK